MPNEIENLISCSRRTKAKHYMPALILLAAEHGASKQEALDLQLSDINFELGESGSIHFRRTKNGKERTQFLMPRTRQALMDWLDHLEKARHRRKISTIDSDYVFCHLNGKRLKSFKKAWGQTCQLAGFDDLHYHDLRHAFCSSLLTTGADLKEVKEMVGHDDLRSTDRYAHLQGLRFRHRQERLAQHYNGMNDESSSVEEA